MRARAILNADHNANAGKGGQVEASGEAWLLNYTMRLGFLAICETLVDCAQLICEAMDRNR